MIVVVAVMIVFVGVECFARFSTRSTGEVVDWWLREWLLVWLKSMTNFSDMRSLPLSWLSSCLVNELTFIDRQFSLRVSLLLFIIFLFNSPCMRFPLLHWQ